MAPLFILLIIVLLLAADQIVLAVRRRRGRPDTRALPFGAERVQLLSRLPVDLRLPGDVFLGRGHTWVKLGPDGPMRVGMDDFAQRFLGRVDAIELPAIGRTVHRGDPLFTVTQGDRRATFRSPVEGVVRRVNGGLREYPALLRESPYGDGWIAEVETLDADRALRPLRLARSAAAWCREELLRLREVVLGGPEAALATLPDGGLPTDSVLEHAGDDAWTSFQTEFLDAEVGHDRP